MAVARKGPVGDAVPLHVAIAPPVPLERLDFRLAEHLAPVEVPFGILELVRGPVVHAEVEVEHHEHRGLEPLGDIERAGAEVEALFRRGWDQHRVGRVSVGKRCRRQEIALGCARGQAGRRPHPLHVHDDDRNFREVGEAHEFRHQGDSGPGGGGHRASPCPAGSDGHADRGELVLGLNNRERRLSCVRIDRETLQVSLRGLCQRRGRRDRIPGNDADAAEDGPRAAAALPSMMILFLFPSMRSTRNGSVFSRFSCAHS